MLLTKVWNKFTHTYKLYCAKREWRRKNSHNNLSINNIFDQSLVTVGKCTYGTINVYSSSHYKSKLKIGNYCSLASNTVFLLAIDHYTDHISTYPFKAHILGEEAEAYSKGDIIISDDVWIGYGATILSGVHIGQGAIIAAGAIVSKNIPPYAIVGGVPARVLKYRFSPEIIDKLMKIDYSVLSEDCVRENIDKLYEVVDESTNLDWLPRKKSNE